MASSESFLLSLAAEENIPPERIRPIIDRLNQEWYDTKESLRKLTTEEMERLNIPLRLARLIVEKLGSGEAQQSWAAPKEEQPAKSESEGGQQMAVEKGDCLAALVSAGIDDLVDGGLTDCITTLQVIILNILRHPGDDKFTRIRLTNPNISKKIARFPDAVAFLKVTGFSPDPDQSLVLRSPNEAELKEALAELNTVAENLGFPAMEIAPSPALAFDPYKAQISSVNPDNPRIVSTDNDPAAIARKKEQLQKAREVLSIQEEAKRAQVNRDPVVLQISATGNVQAALRRMEEMENQRLQAKFGIGYTVAGGLVGSQQGAREDEELGAMKALIKVTTISGKRRELQVSLQAESRVIPP